MTATAILLPFVGLLIGTGLGVLGGRTHYCFMGAISDAVLFNSARRLRAWGLALAIALVGTQALALAGLPLAASPYRAMPAFWLGAPLGGVAFGIGMVLAGGCAFRTLVRAGGGSLRALAVALVVALTAWAGGVLGLSPPLSPPLSAAGEDVQAAWRYPLALVLAAGLAWYWWREPRAAARAEAGRIGAAFGLAVPACFAAAWALDGRLDGLALAVQSGGLVKAALEGTGSGGPGPGGLGWGLVLGTLLGALVDASLRRTLRADKFVDRKDVARHLAGGALMGLGAAAAMGCTLGQGLSGLATLASSAVLAAAGIVLGAIVTLRYMLYGPGLGLGQQGA